MPYSSTPTRKSAFFWLLLAFVDDYEVSTYTSRGFLYYFCDAMHGSRHLHRVIFVVVLWPALIPYVAWIPGGLGSFLAGPHALDTSACGKALSGRIEYIAVSFSSHSYQHDYGVVKLYASSPAVDSRRGLLERTISRGVIACFRCQFSCFGAH